MGKREELEQKKQEADQGQIKIGNRVIEPQDGDTSWSKPSKQYERLSDEAKKDLQDRFGKTNINFLIENQAAIDSFFADPKNAQPGGSSLDPRVSNFLEMLSKDPTSFYEATLFYPNVKRIYDKWTKWITDYTRNAKEAEDKAKSTKPTFEEYMKSFSNDPKVSFQQMTDHLETSKRISEWISKHERPDTPPEDPRPWEMRIGASKFVVPPVNVQVSQQFGTGSMTGGVLRQQNTPKFNTGHSDTLINVTLYFPNHEAIWGLSALTSDPSKSGLVKDINFEEASDREIDSFLSSLRGLITQFKYAPILPIRNDFLNKTYGITAVCMQSMTVQTLENYPYCLTVNLQMVKFNHKVFLPMIKDFNQAIHWGRYRLYMGKAAKWISGNVSKGFLLETKQDDGTSKIDIENPFSETFNVYNELGLTPAVDDMTSIEAVNKTDWSDVSKLKLYYPIKTPAKVFVPDTLSWHQYGEDSIYQTQSDAWSDFLSGMGFQPITETQSFYDYLDELGRTSNTSGQIIGLPNDRQLLIEYLRISAATVNEMTPDKLNSFLQKMSDARKKEDPNWDNNQDAKNKAISDWKTMWYYEMFNLFRESPLWRIRQIQLKNKAEQRISEWAVPMEELSLDWNNIYVHGTAVSISNNFARLQVQMQDEPTFQHIGGGDSQISVALTVFGEDNLIRLRRLFDHINGLARLEHSHGVLGFLGIKNLVTALCGVKHIIPLNFETETIPNYPHVYTVRLSFVDFDVTQQRREELSTAQQKELVDAFGTKRNPFLRVKQLWGAFNAYPDFPLHITDDEGKIIGHLEPDYYYKAFRTIDDDLVNPDLQKRPGAIHDAAEEARRLMDQGSNGEKAVQSGTDGAGKANGASATTSGNPFWPQKPAKIEPPATANEKDTTAPTLTSNPDGTLKKGTEPGGTGLEQIDNLSGAANLMVKNFFPVGGENKDKAGALYNVAGSLAGVNIDASSGKASIGLEWSNISEDYAARNLKDSNLEGFTPNSHYNQPLHSEKGYNEGDPAIHWQKMLVDSQYRDISGRMVRAYPTFMLWLIDEGGNFAGVKLFDNFYGLQSVIDFSVSSSEDVLGDTLVLRVSNLYSKLTSEYSLYAGKHDGTTPESDLVDKLYIGEDNLISGTTNEIREIGQIRLKPGVRVHLRAGYSANPNLLRTIFNGTITQVTQGDIVEITAQSDAIELAPYINTTDSKGDSNGLDGAATGLWLSEPRDLMVKLLSMGSSTFREAIANATQGMIFSENKFGIRHFGQILYEPLNNAEEDLHNQRYDAVKAALDSFVQDPGGAVASTAGSTSAGAAAFTTVTTGGFDSMLGNQSQVRSGAIPLMQMLATNFFRSRDYELFKRNIYPGNGTGIAQYLGGDFPEAGLMIADASGSDSQSIKPLPTPKANNMRDAERAKAAQKGSTQDQNVKSDSQRDEIEKQNRNTNSIGSSADGKKPPEPKSTENQDTPDGLTGFAGPVGGWALFKGFGSLSNLAQNPLMQMLGIESATEDDLAGFDEVSFRAQTYMKSVWDLFQLCAALLPNYIVAVRPFEDRSTVFYGKPHWLYTSGVIPITAGLPKASTQDFIKPNSELKETLRKLENLANPLSDLQDQQDLISSLGKVQTLSGAATNVAGKKADGNTNKAKIWNFLLQKGASIGLGPAQVAGIMGNIEVESAGTWDPGIIEYSGGGGYGIVQWTASRRTDIENFAKSTGKAPDDLEMQVDFIIKELTGPYKGSTLDKIVKIQDVREITKIFMKNYENPANQSDEAQNDRANRAEAIYKEFQNAVSTETVTNETTTPEASGGLPGQGVGSVVAPIGKEPESKDVADYVKNISKVVRDQKGYLPGALVSVWSPNVGAKAENFAEYGPGKSNWADDPIGHFSRLLYDRKYAHDIAQARKEHPEDIQSLGDAFKDKTDMNFDKVFDLGELEVFAVGKDIKPGEDPPPGVVAVVAEKIWDEFRNNWLLGNENFPKIEEEFKKSPWGTENDVVHFGAKANEEPTEDNSFYKMGEEEYWKKAESEGINEDFGLDNEKYKFVPTKLVGGFRKFLWTNAYARAWLIVTTGFHTNWIEGVADAMKGGENALPENLSTAMKIAAPGTFILGKITEMFGDSNNANAQKIQGQIKTLVDLGGNSPTPVGAGLKVISEFLGNGMLCDFENSTVIKAWSTFLELSWAAETAPTWESLEGRASIAKQYLQKVQSKIANVEFGQDPEQTNTTKGWEEIVINPDSVYTQAMLKWMDDNKAPGNKSTSPLAKLGGELSRKYDQTIGRLLNIAGNTLQGLIAQFRLQMFQMGHGLSMVGNMQRQAHILNKILDDSIYYAAGDEGTILRLADNPFTREYGEPVIEIREPFQRMHYIDSFQHILNNGLQENLSGVSTVVTASSDGKYPVTVYFDKGAPSHLQVEKAVETGLYWDNINGEGFFTFLHPLLNPIEYMKGYAKTAQGSSDEMLSKRVALYHLRESLKDIYTGEILVLGNPDIRAHDLVYIADVYERIYGLVEVEEVIHHFTPDMGFVTSITPNALVTVQDPNRWAMQNWMTSVWGAKNLRDDARNMLQVYSDDSSLVHNSEIITSDELADSLGPQMLGKTIYTGGSSALMKDVLAAKASGFLMTQQQRLMYLQKIQEFGKKHEDGQLPNPLKMGPIGMAMGAVTDAPNVDKDPTAEANAKMQFNQPIIGPFIAQGWDFAKWLKENLMDQHDCYIQFLTKDGQPMDAGLSYSQGLVVGSFNTVNILPNILGLQSVTPDPVTGAVRITTNDLLERLGWTEYDSARAYREMSWWIAQTNANVLEAAGGISSDVGMNDSNISVTLAKVVRVLDGDTIAVSPIDGPMTSAKAGTDGLVHIRLVGAKAYELPDKENPGGPRVSEDHPGLRAKEYLVSRLIDYPRSQGWEPIVAIRQDKTATQDAYKRQLGVVFSNISATSVDSTQRAKTLQDFAKEIPPIPWNGYLDNGQPYTINWEIIMAGYADVDTYSVSDKPDEIRGASLINPSYNKTGNPPKSGG